MKIVRLTENDLSQVFNLERLCYKDPWTLDNFLGEFKRPFTVALGLREGEKLLGQCFFWRLAPEIHLLNLGIHPDHRERGLGRRLTRAMITLGRATEIKEIHLEVRPSNLPALALYRSLGFIRTGRRPDYYDDGEEAWLLTLFLTRSARADIEARWP